MNENKTVFDNTVPAKNQLNSSERVYYLGNNTPSKKVLIFGNSITLHGVKADLSWFGHWEMTASAPKKRLCIPALYHHPTRCAGRTVLRSADWLVENGL